MELRHTKSTDNPNMSANQTKRRLPSYWSSNGDRTPIIMVLSSLANRQSKRALLTYAVVDYCTVIGGVERYKRQIIEINALCVLYQNIPYEEVTGQTMRNRAYSQAFSERKMRLCCFFVCCLHHRENLDAHLAVIRVRFLVTRVS